MVPRLNNLDHNVVRFDVLPRRHAIGDKVSRAVGDVLNAMGYLAFTIGLAGLAVIGFAVTAGGVSATLLTVPAYFTIGGGMSCLIGAVLQGLGKREVTDLNFSNII